MKLHVYLSGLCFCLFAGIAQAQDDKPLPTILTLDEAKRIALSESPTLQAAQARVEQAQAVLKQSRSEFLPIVGATAGASFTELSDNDAEQGAAQAQFFGQSFDDTVEGYQGSISLRYLIFDGFGRKFRNAYARLGAERSESAMMETNRLLMNAVSLAYHNVQLARENINIAKADEAFNDRQLKEAQLRYKAGKGSLSDTLNFEVRIRAAQSNLLQAKRSHSVALIVLVQLMGVEHKRVPDGMDVDVLMLERDDEMNPLNEDELVAKGLAIRPDLKNIETLLDQSDALVGIGRSSYFPTVSGVISGDASRLDNGYFEEDDVSSTVGIQMEYTFFNGGRRKAMLSENKAFRREVKHSLDEQGIAVVAEVREAARNLETAQKVLILQRETTSLVEQNRDLVEKEYRAGQGSLVRLNQAQRDLTSQQASLASARVSLHQAWVNLDSATGAILK